MRRYIETEHAQTRMQLAFMNGAFTMLGIVIAAFLGVWCWLEWIA